MQLEKNDVVPTSSQDEALARYSVSRDPDGAVVKNLPANAGDVVRTLNREDPLEKKMATHSSILLWEIPWTEEPGRLQSMGSLKVGHN